MDYKMLDNYLNEIQLNNVNKYLSEDVKSIIGKLKSLNIKKIIESLKGAADSKNINKIKSVFKSIKIPNISIDSVKENLKNKKPEFNKLFNMSKKVIKNSIPKLPEKNVDALSLVVAAKSITTNKPMEATKKNLILTVGQTRKYIGSGSPSGINTGTVIVIIYAIASLLSGITMGASFSILLLVGALLGVGKTLVD